MASRSRREVAQQPGRQRPPESFSGRASHSPRNSDGRRNQHAAGGADEAAADDAHQDRALEGDIGGVEVVHPVRTSTPSASGVLTMSTISSFSPRVRSSRNSSTRKRRARTSTLLMAAATPSRISKVTRMSRWSNQLLVVSGSVSRSSHARTLSVRNSLRRLMPLSTCSYPIALPAQRCSARRVRRAALRHVAVAAAARAELPAPFASSARPCRCQPGRLRKHQRRLRASATEQGDACPALRELLRQHLDEAEIAVSKELASPASAPPRLRR